MESLFKLVKFLTRYLTLWIILSAVVAFLMPAPFMHGDWIPYLIGCVMLSMGLSMTPGDFKLVLTRPRDVILGIIVISVCMPLVGLGIGTLLGLPPMLIVGLILVGCTPSGATSNVMTMISNGDKALSVTTSSLGTLISPFVTPALLMFYVGHYMPLDALAMFIGIIKIVIIPIALGLLIRKVFSKQMDTVLKLAPLLTVAAVVVVIAVVVSLNVERIKLVGVEIALACAFYTICGMIIGYVAARIFHMELSRRKAMTFLIGIQNTALAVSLGITYFDPLAAVPGGVLIVWASVLGTLVASFWAGKTQNTVTETLKN